MSYIAQVFANLTVLALEEVLITMYRSSRVIKFRFRWQISMIDVSVTLRPTELVPLRKAPTWCLLTKLSKFG